MLPKHKNPNDDPDSRHHDHPTNTVQHVSFLIKIQQESIQCHGENAAGPFPKQRPETNFADPAQRFQARIDAIKNAKSQNGKQKAQQQAQRK